MGNHGQWAPRPLGVDMVHTRMVNVGKEQRVGCPVLVAYLLYSGIFSGLFWVRMKLPHKEN